jgi:hypothetical protein
MRPTRLSTLTLVALGFAAVTWLIVRSAYQSLPPLPWTGMPALLAVAFLEAGSGWDLRRRITGRRGVKRADPLLVSRMFVLARASSLGGALIAGVTLGFIGYLSSQLSAVQPRHDMVTAGITCGAAVVLVAAALFLEYCCRVPANTNSPTDANQPADR